MHRQATDAIVNPTTAAQNRFIAVKVAKIALIDFQSFTESRKGKPSIAQTMNDGWGGFFNQFDSVGEKKSLANDGRLQ
jgi:hypothetical protein